MLTDKQHSVVKRVAEKSGFENFDISVVENTVKGDNYLGHISKITIKERNTTKEKLLILKVADKSEQLRTQFPLSKCYEREAYMYKKVLPAFAELQRRNNLPHRFEAFAELHGYSLDDGEEFLILEDITTLGFKMMNRKVCMNEDQIGIVFKELGKLHSLTFAMKHLQPELYKELSDNLVDYFKEHKNIVDSWILNIKNNFQHAYKAVEGNEDATLALDELKKGLAIQDDDENLVIIHGDAWCNNMMFKYENGDTSKSTKLCFLDWQISKITSPVFDLCYFMFLSAPKAALDDHRKYLFMYHQIIEENLRSIDCDPQKVFPFELLMCHWKKFCKIGLLMALSTLQILMRDEKDAKTLSEIASDGSDIFQELLKVDSPIDGYYKRIADIILMMVENKYI